MADPGDDPMCDDPQVAAAAAPPPSPAGEPNYDTESDDPEPDAPVVVKTEPVVVVQGEIVPPAESFASVIVATTGEGAAAGGGAGILDLVSSDESGILTNDDVTAWFKTNGGYMFNLNWRQEGREIFAWRSTLKVVRDVEIGGSKEATPIAQILHGKVKDVADFQNKLDMKEKPGKKSPARPSFANCKKKELAI